MTELLRGYAGPILAIHGDSHNDRFDHPLPDPETGTAMKRFTRLEVPGQPTVAGVRVTLNAGNAGAVTPESRDGLRE